jgi:HAD superfamily hydrolase (TIGR01509 family)
MMEEERMIQALIFDFDGLILDTETPRFRSWQEVFREHGCSLSVEDWAAWIDGSPAAADPVAMLEQGLGCRADRRAIHERRLQRELELLAGERPMPGIEQILAEGNELGLKLAIVSNSSRDWVAGHLTRLGLRARFDSLLCAEDVAQLKPDPALYQATLDALGMRADQAIAFEDSPRGVLAARRAGVYCVAVPNPVTRSLSLSEADMEWTSLREMPLQRLLTSVGRHE